ncbi:MAG: anthranilate/aminodeoxychorismate synthase component II, partial [Gammaproteobacteria bacterium]
GGKVIRARKVMHGKTSMIEHDGQTLYQGLTNPFQAGRYHSLAAEAASLPSVLEVSARSERGEIMGVRHREFSLEGVQFHPESVLTPEGNRLLANFLAMSSLNLPAGTR